MHSWEQSFVGICFSLIALQGVRNPFLAQLCHFCVQKKVDHNLSLGNDLPTAFSLAKRCLVMVVLKSLYSFLPCQFPEGIYRTFPRLPKLNSPPRVQTRQLILRYHTFFFGH